MMYLFPQCSTGVRTSGFRNPAFILIGLGAVLRLIQYGSGRSIWLDEACLLLNVLHRGYGNLLQPLDHHQVAPVLFPWLLKAGADMAGHSDAVFRFIPLLLSLLALPWVYPLARRWSGSARVALLTLVFFACALFLVRYATEVKQYTVDLTVCLGLCWWLTALRRSLTRRQQIGLSLAGLLCIGISNVAILMMATLGLFHLWAALHQPRRWAMLRSLLLPGGIWAVSFGIYYTFFIYQHPTRPYMEHYWQFAFMPSNPFSLAWWQWCAQHIPYFFFKIFFYDFNGQSIWRGWLAAYLVFWGLGVWQGWRHERRTMLFFTFVPTGLHLLLSTLHLYPFDPRIALYLAFPHFLCAAYGLNSAWIGLKNSAGPVSATAFLALALAIWPIQLFRNFPVRFDEMRQSLAFWKEHNQECSRIYLPANTHHIFDYYRAIGQIAVTGPVFYGDYCSARAEPQALDSLQGCLWLITAHLSPAQESALVRCLQERGQLRRQFFTKGSAACLFDLKPFRGDTSLQRCACLAQ